jgi:hypothetical protein
VEAGAARLEDALFKFMPDELPLSEALYQDAKRLIRFVAQPLIRPFLEARQRRSALASFSPDLVRHDISITHFVDYYNWHEQDTDWLEGNGFLAAATYGELFYIWANPDVFVSYEARLLRFIRRGGVVRRIYVLGPYIRDPVGLWALERTLLRHQRLGFLTRVGSVLDLREEIREIGINCEMYGVLNGRIGYFLRFPPNEPPIMLRSIDKRLVWRAENHFRKLWQAGEDSQSWYRRQSNKLPQEILNQIELDLEAVVNVSQ